MKPINEQIKDKIRKGCGFDIFNNGIYICGKTKTYSSPRSERYKICLCRTCKAKLQILEQVEKKMKLNWRQKNENN